MKEEDIKLAKWLEGKMEGGELEAFKKSPEYHTYQKIKEYSAELTAPQADIDTIYKNVAKSRNQNKGVRKLTPWFTKIAAVLIIVLGVTFFFYTTHTTNQIAKAGEHTEFLLPDNSTVMLNSGSEAEFKSWNWNNNRKVELNGEAFFKVAKGKKFDVVTSNGTVTVVGTQFNVKNRNNRFEVTCYEGKVKVTSNGTEVLLTPGQTVAYEGNEQVAVGFETDTTPGWLTYETEFHKETFDNVVAEIERQYNIEIETNKGNYSTFSGVLPMDNLDEALDIFTTAYQLKTKKTGSKIILTPMNESKH